MNPYYNRPLFRNAAKWLKTNIQCIKLQIKLHCKHRHRYEFLTPHLQNRIDLKKKRKNNNNKRYFRISLYILDSCSGASHSDEECALVLLSSVLYLTSIEGQQGNRENLMGCTCVGVWRACKLAFLCCCCFGLIFLGEFSPPPM